MLILLGLFARLPSADAGGNPVWARYAGHAIPQTVTQRKTSEKNEDFT